MRVRNEARWIESVVRAILPVSDHVLILDDKSDDATPDICESIEGVRLFRSESSTRDESADKDWLLSQAYELLEDKDKKGNPDSPWFAILIDGDEQLFTEDQELVRQLAQSQGGQNMDAFKFKIPYAWDSPDKIRVDGVYSHMANVGRPSMFRLMNDQFRFQRTRFGGGQNFHCSSVPQEMLHSARASDVRLLHWGYMHKEDRIRKFAWYNQHDPNNFAAEDCYKHMVIGDIFPAESRFKHAGPLELRPL